MTHRFAELTSTAAGRLLTDRRRPMLLLPVGSTEPHGPHSPLATDPLISAGMCDRVAAALADDPDVRVLVLPSLDYGVTRYTAGFPGRIHVGEATLQAMLRDICMSLIAEGFPLIAVVNNHFEPEHVQTRPPGARPGGGRDGRRRRLPRPHPQGARDTTHRGVPPG